MSTPIIVMGATGRMGTTIAHLVEEAADLTLAAVHTVAEQEAKLAMYDCFGGSDVAAVFASVQNAVIIDFTAPDASVNHAHLAAQYGHALVIGTTGFSDEQKAELEEIAKTTPLFWSPNMSVGVNVLLKVLPELVRLLGEDYDLEMVELHHNKKKDSPSGTALRLAECLAEARDWSLPEVACYHREGIIGERPKKEIGVQTIRGGDVVGVHTVFCMGPGERIEVTHQAHSRENFANGAIRAAKWLAKKEPHHLYSMLDIL
ncbi:MAG: 4-hydroxy-tetrahydrodipicolinate reductase [Pseudomonadota bacterium]